MTNNSTYLNFISQSSPIAAGYRIAVCILLLLLSYVSCFAKNKEVPDYNEYEYGADALGYDETSIFINVQRVGGTDIPAVIRDRIVYLPITDVFDFLKIKNAPSPGLDSITGFFIDPQATFIIDKTHNCIRYRGKYIKLNADDFIRTDANLYLRMDYFSQVFGLDCMFDFHNLSVKVNTTQELPAIREMRQAQIRNNISQLKGEIKADTIIGRNYPFFHIGMADWSVVSMQEIKGRTDTRMGLALGSVLAGGELNVALNYFSNTPLDSRQQYYQWRYANNDHKALRQVMLGKISPQAVASLFAPVVGVQLTNASTTFRRSFETYTLSDITSPGWIVELYVNNVMVDYTKADASGFFSFEVPLVYGNSAVKLRFYGPFGEERIREEYITVPYNFLPSKEFEYTASAGIVEDGHSSRYAKANVNYGLSRRFTIGGGMEYLSSVTSGNFMPFASASFRIASGLMLSGEYMHGVRTKGMLSYRLPSNIQVELNYTRYANKQTAIIFNYLEERKAVLFIPFHTNNISLVSRLTLNQIVLPERLKYTTGEWLISGSVAGVNASISTNMVSVKKSDPVKFDPYFYSNVALAFRLPKGFIVTPNAQYGYKEKNLISVKCSVEKLVFRNGFLNINYEQNFKSNIKNVGIGLRYDFSFARVGVSARQSNNTVQLVQSARGSLIFDGKTKYVGATNRTSVGRAGITILPYLDINGNERRDEGEPKVQGLEAQIRNGRSTYSQRDSLIRIFDLEPYINYLIDLTHNSFEDISWQIRNKTLSVVADPNQLKVIEIPVAVMGEVSGSVSLKNEGGHKGLERVKVCFYKNDTTLVAYTFTEQDGTFNFLGLGPGTYTARPDAEQLKKLNMTVWPALLSFNISGSKEGTTVEDITFTLRPANNQNKEMQDNN
jgi:opacity protein-like surface antigen